MKSSNYSTNRRDELIARIVLACPKEELSKLTSLFSKAEIDQIISEHENILEEVLIAQALHLV